AGRDAHHPTVLVGGLDAGGATRERLIEGRVVGVQELPVAAVVARLRHRARTVGAPTLEQGVERIRTALERIRIAGLHAGIVARVVHLCPTAARILLAE